MAWLSGAFVWIFVVFCYFVAFFGENNWQCDGSAVAIERMRPRTLVKMAGNNPPAIAFAPPTPPPPQVAPPPMPAPMINQHTNSQQAPPLLAKAWSEQQPLLQQYQSVGQPTLSQPMPAAGLLVCKPKSQATSAGGSSRLQVSTGFYVYNLVRIDELAESVTVMADFYYSWHDECVWREAVRRSKFAISTEQHLSIEPESFPYKIPIVHLNSVDDMQAADNNGRHLPVEIFANGLVERNSVGAWSTRCKADASSLLYFPFDQTTCEFHFLSWLTQDYVNFSTAEMSQAAEIMPFASDLIPWRLIVSSLESRVSRLCFAMSDERSYCSSTAVFTMRLQRKGSAFLSTLFLPSVLLAVVLLASFFLPPSMHRFAILFAVSFGFALVLQAVKQMLVNLDAAIVYLVLHLNWNITLSVASSVYTLICAGLKERQSRCSNCRQHRFPTVELDDDVDNDDEQVTLDHNNNNNNTKNRNQFGTDNNNDEHNDVILFDAVMPVNMTVGKCSLQQPLRPSPNNSPLNNNRNQLKSSCLVPSSASSNNNKQAYKGKVHNAVTILPSVLMARRRRQKQRRQSVANKIGSVDLATGGSRNSTQLSTASSPTSCCCSCFDCCHTLDVLVALLLFGLVIAEHVLCLVCFSNFFTSSSSDNTVAE